MPSDHRPFADQLLDASLERFSTVEPRAGLEGRILAGVAARHRATERRRWVFGFAACALAVLALAVAVRMARRSTAPASIPLRASSPAGTLLPLAPTVGARHTVAQSLRAAGHGVPLQIHATRVRETTGRGERPQQFPTPTPLSEQEKLLLLYVEEAPKSVLADSPVNLQRDLEVPDLKIAALEIKDLASADETQ